MIHIAAARSCVASMVEILTKTNNAHLDTVDNDGRTPVSVAAEQGALQHSVSGTFDAAREEC